MSEFIERSKYSCALGGAISTVLGLHRTVPIVHAAGGCATSLSNTYNLASGYRGTGYCGGTMIPTSNISENHIVFGGEERLEEQIEETLEAFDGDLYVVVTGCQVEIIGDDAVGVASRFKEKKVVAASTPGFSGNTNTGYDAVLISLIEQIINVSDKKEEKVINILGVVPGQDVFYRGNLDQLVRLLELIGIKANTFFGTGETIDKIREYGKASLNVVLNKTAGISTAEKFYEIHNIPYIQTELPIGIDSSKNFLRLLGKELSIDPVLVEEVIKKEERLYYSYFERLIDIYADIDYQRYGIIVADSYYAYSLTNFLTNDLGWVPYFVAINDIQNQEEQENYLKLFQTLTSDYIPNICFIEHASKVYEQLIENSTSTNKYKNNFDPAFVVGSVIERGLAAKINAPLLSVSFPVSNRVVLNKGYAGFQGALSLVEDLLSVLVATR